jgi:hypothetical protein
MVQHCRNIHSIEVDDEVRNNIDLKGLSQEMDLVFGWLVLGLNRGRGHF